MAVHKEHSRRTRVLFSSGLVLLAMVLALVGANAGAWAISPTIWTNFAPQGWVNVGAIDAQVQASDLDGVTDVAEYRYTTTGNIAAASWISAGLSVSGTAATSKVIHVTGLSLPDSANQNLVQFRIQKAPDMLVESPNYTIMVDSTPPQNPNVINSSSHTVGRWSNDRTVDLSWSGASDLSGIAGYSTLWDAQTATLPPDTINTTGAQATSPSLNDGTHYFHIRARDNAQNWAAGAAHAGPYLIDTVPPTNPNSVTSSSHPVSAWSTDNSIEVSWHAGADGLSGIGGYSVVWDENPTTVPDMVTDTLALGMVSSPRADGQNTWFHIRATDRAGNWASGADHLGPFWIDAAPPANPTLFQTSHITNTWSNNPIITISWNAAQDSGSGVAGYSYVWDEQPTTLPPETVRTTGLLAVSPQQAHGARVYFHLRVRDNLGHWSAPVHLGPFPIDLQAPTPPSLFSALPLGWTNVNAFTILWDRNPNDLSGIGGAYCKLDAPPVSNSDFYTLTRSADIHGLSNLALPTDGVHDVYIWLEDNAGNADYRTAFPVRNVFHLDRQAPVSTHSLSRAPDCESGWYTATVTVYPSATDPILSGVNAVSQVAVISYTIDSGATRSLVGPSFVVSGEGAHTVQYLAVDNAGNREAARTVDPPIKIDLHPPVSGVSQITGEQGAQGWYKGPVQVSLAATDSASGVSEIWHRHKKTTQSVWSEWTKSANLTLSQEGRYQIQHYAVDGACHRELAQELEITINLDLAAPITTYAVRGAAGQNGWYVSSPITVTLSPTDTMSGVGQTFYRFVGEANWRVWTGAPIVVVGEGIQHIEYYSTDQAGNTEFASVIQLGIDTVAPALTTRPQPLPIGWSKNNLFSFSWTNPADTSGVIGVYYKLDYEPQSSSDWTGSFISTKVITQCTGIAVSEGRHGIYVWLVDKAGNADYTTARYRPDFFWYDGTPPQVQVMATGDSQGLWYRSTVTLTFSASDPIPPQVNEASGVKAIHYSVGCGANWETGNRVVISQEGRITVCYRAEDNAGNVSETRSRTFYIDYTAPPSPATLTIAPADWSSSNRFAISWNNPADISGITGAYYAFGEPGAPDGGTLIPGSDRCLGNCSGEITVPGEGIWDLYFWFADAAGNNGWQIPYYKHAGFSYDRTPPVSVAQFTGKLGLNGWYTSPVVMTLSAHDNLAGVAQSRYRVRAPDQLWGAWQTYAAPLTITANGLTTIRYNAVDNAENQENEHEQAFKIDTQPPYVQLEKLPSVITLLTPGSSFPACWRGAEPSPGSGLSSFDVQFRDGLRGAWTGWQENTIESCVDFAPLPGHVYYFRARAQDVAGNKSEYSGSALYGETRTYIQSVINGGFDAPQFSGWEHGGPLGARQVITQSHDGDQQQVILLGQPELGRGGGTVPIGFGAITQTITVPLLDELADPRLSFWYRVFSYDVVYDSQQKLWDSFDVSILDAVGREVELVVRDGYFGDHSPDMVVADTGWKQKQVSLAKYAGQTITIRLACHNRVDNNYNTWAFTDDVRVLGYLPYKVELPVITRNH
jgi:hypothetical protein